MSSTLVERIEKLGFLPTPELQEEVQRLALSKVPDSTITAAWRAQRKAIKDKETAAAAAAKGKAGAGAPPAAT
jgi:hypothetical protein